MGLPSYFSTALLCSGHCRFEEIVQSVGLTKMAPKRRGGPSSTITGTITAAATTGRAGVHASESVKINITKISGGRSTKKRQKEEKKQSHYTRSGVEEGAVRLAPIRSSIVWERIEAQHDEMSKFEFNSLADSKLMDLTNAMYSLGRQLRQQRREYQSSKKDSNESPLTATFSCNSEIGLLSKANLMDIVIEWKFTRGQPRRALLKHLKNNADVDVRKSLCEALLHCNHAKASGGGEAEDDEEDNSIRNAIQSFSRLKGVGPATASAVLSLYRPDLFVFMDDEVIECLHDGKRAYTLDIYCSVNKKCREIAKELNADAISKRNDSDALDHDGEWTPNRVGRALWTASQLAASGKEINLEE